mmetsp:Transcript_6476/g.13999  ORF Transcript_6476/g.13999 Transcript_6476/m.13999 type:complete len:95 (+) Transcript_6476:1342-1626(+)
MIHGHVHFVVYAVRHDHGVRPGHIEVIVIRTFVDDAIASHHVVMIDHAVELHDLVIIILLKKVLGLHDYHYYRRYNSLLKRLGYFTRLIVLFCV